MIELDAQTTNRKGRRIWVECANSWGMVRARGECARELDKQLRRKDESTQ